MDENKIVILIIISAVAVIIGSSYLENDFENSILGFRVPDNWTVVDVTTADSIVGLKPINSTSPVISITSTDISPQEVVNGYIDSYSVKYPNLQVLKNEPVSVDGVNGIRLVFKNRAMNDTLFTGPDYMTSVITFSKYNQTYIIISEEVSQTDYTTLVEPAMNSLVKSLRIKGY